MPKQLLITDYIDENLKRVRDADGTDAPISLSKDKMKVSGDLDIKGGLTADGDTKVSNGDVTIDSAKKIYLDGGGDTYIAETLADRLEINVGGEPLIVLREAGGGADDSLTIPTLTKLYFDGGNDTYIHESAADVLDFIVGGINMLRLDEANGFIDILSDNI